MLFSFSFLAHAVDTNSTRLLYLNFKGEDPDHSIDVVMEKIRTLFINPIDQVEPFSIRSWNVLIHGPRHAFTFNIILEPLNPASVPAFDHYVSTLEGKEILGSKVHFEPVAKLQETVHLEIGIYDHSLDDPFIIKFDYPRLFEWPTLETWLNDSNEYGYILLGHDHAKFENYVMSFIDRSAQKSQIVELLKTNDVMALRSDVDVILQSGLTIQAATPDSPFLQFRFFRNCFQTEFENGTCF